MARVEKSINVNVPIMTAYNQWTRFEEFPRFMEGVESVTRIDENRLHWAAKIGGRRKEWYARISDEIPGERIAWYSEGGAPNSGVVTFHSVNDNTTRIMLQMEYDPEDFTEEVGDKLGFMSRRVEGDIKRFKDYVEGRSVETGAWRGEAQRP